MRAYTSSSCSSAMSGARGAIGSGSTPPASSDPTDCSSGGRPVLTLSALPLQVTGAAVIDRKSTRLNSSHQIISYAVFCLKKKKQKEPNTQGLNLDTSYANPVRTERSFTEL